MRRFYFEITDVMEHALQGNRRVTGIQRVQLSLIRLIAEKHGPGRISCLCYRQHDDAMIEFDPMPLLSRSGEYDSERMLFQLGFLPGCALFPSKVAVKRYVRDHAGKQWQKNWLRAGVMIAALLFPWRLKRMRLARARDQFCGIEPIATRRLHNLPEHDSLVFFGVSSRIPRVRRLAAQHAGGGGDVVQFMYDLIPVVRPEFCTESMVSEFKDWLAQVVAPLASRVICISQWTMQDFCREIRLQRPHGKISAISLAHEFSGYQRNADNRQDLPASVRDLTGFVLCVGTIEARKNGVALLKCWLKLYSELGERLPYLVFAGKRGWLAEEFYSLLSSPILRRRVLLIESPSDRNLAALYEACLFTVYPSHYEGWGLPVGEAAWFGKYSIVSDSSSLPEVCGKLVDYINVADMESIVAVSAKAILDREYLSHREHQIRLAKLRTWQDVADDVWSFLDSP